MLREPVLNTKRFELGKCVASRKRKLSELYSVLATVAATGTAPSTPQEPLDSNTGSKFSEAEFQDANDITKGRSFGVATLLRIPGFGYNHATCPSPKTVQHTGELKNTTSWETSHGYGPAVAQSVSKSSQTMLSDDQDGTTRAQAAAKGNNGKLPATLDPFGDGEDRMDTVAANRGHNEESELAAAHVVAGRRNKALGARPITPAGSSPLSRPEEGPQIPQADDLGSFTNGQPQGNPPSPSRTLQVKTPSEDGSRHLSTEGSMLKPATEVSSIAAASPLTPDAQLHHEAAQFMGSQNQAKLAKVPENKAFEANPVAERSVSGKPRDLNSKAGVLQDSTLASRRHGASGEQRLEGMASENSKDIMLSQRPPMRIDTAVGRPTLLNETPTPSTSFTPLKSAQVGMHSSPPERMTTRVGSGAIRHKSVSEILGGTPRTATTQGDRTPLDSSRDENHYLSRRGSLVASPESASFKSRLNEIKEREKDRSKLSTVVFARPQAGDKTRGNEDKLGHAARAGKSDHEKDYLVPLFAAQAAAQTPTLSDLIRNAHKTISTANHYVEYHEAQDCRILKRIYHLQNSNRWSLRQLERSAEPPRPNSHWDILLNEVKWMRTDFREERKWKITAARNLAESCAEWKLAPSELRSSLQVRVRAPGSKAKTTRTHSRATSSHKVDESVRSDSTPELVSSAEDDLSDVPEEDLPHMDISKANAPAALFSLAPEDVLFSLDKTPTADKLLSELPLYQPFDDPRGTNRNCSEILDAAWQKPIVPVSKYALGKMVIKDHAPPRKRSRYNYTEEDEGEFDSTGRALLPLDQKKKPIPPEKDDVALFNPQNKHIIARLHAAHAFRPPSEFGMPSQQFFESRNPSQWTLAEDDELRRSVREYEYNWSLISACLSSPSLLSSGAERRTPWECFERWESFEGLPGDMDKHSYFRAWKSRRANAKQHLEQLFIAQQNASNTVPLRRRTAEPVHVERRRNQKHLNLIHAMSKVAKKKETAIQKQQHAASMAAMRKAAEPSSMRLRMQTPQEFSAHKHKQELEFKEKQALYRQQVIATQRALLTQKAAQQNGQQQGSLGVPQPSRMAMPASMNGTSPHLASSLPHNSTTQPGGRPLPPSQAMLNGMIPNGANQNGQIGVRGGAVGVPQAQLQSYLQGQQQRLPTQNTPDRVIMEASRLQEQQRLMQQRQYQANGTNGVSPSPHNHNMNVQQNPQQMQPNAAILGNMQPNGKPGPAIGAQGQQRSSGSPSVTGQVPTQQLSSGMIPLLNQISAHLKANHPNLSADQIKSMATANLNQHLRAQNSQVGNNPSNGSLLPQSQGNGYPQPMNSAMYSHIMRSQQASQQQSRPGGEANGVRPESRGGTPQTKGGPTPSGSSQSPHPPQAQMASSS